MSVVFNLTGHRALWDWLANNPKRAKYEWPGWQRNGGKYEIIDNYCFACDYAAKKGLNCYKCPLVGWGSDGKFCIGRFERNLYGRWKDCYLSERSELAAKIRDLPVREGVEYE